MRNRPHRRAPLPAAIACAAAASSLALLSAPCRANVAPESGLLVHVEPVRDWFETSITDCHEIVRSTTVDGPLEFLVFFMTGHPWGEPVCLRSLRTSVEWPDAWEMVQFEAWVGQGSLFGHELELDFYYSSDYPVGAPGGSVVPLARFVVNVVGPGRLRLGDDPVRLKHGCTGPEFLTYPVSVFAEAGMTCGYLTSHCATSEAACAAAFRVAELHLSASAGGVADSTLPFTAPQWYNPDALCPLTVDTHAPWCTASIAETGPFGHADLHVMADASGLVPGSHETQIEIYSGPPWMASRCLPVEFTVLDGPTASPRRSWGQVKTIYR